MCICVCYMGICLCSWRSSSYSLVIFWAIMHLQLGPASWFFELLDNNL
uniref:Uncharacterized protein n=1 Tax=Rhizophora mucronata TaxID=61149 RepID=A0A2P2IIF0_RHIMU